MKSDVSFLAADSADGRAPGTKGIEASADYIAGVFKKAGLKPAPGARRLFPAVHDFRRRLPQAETSSWRSPARTAKTSSRDTRGIHAAGHRHGPDTRKNADRLRRLRHHGPGRVRATRGSTTTTMQASTSRARRC